ncbi:hypothetical protein ACP4OV_009178 [Aristida adscensionis]
MAAKFELHCAAAGAVMAKEEMMLQALVAAAPVFEEHQRGDLDCSACVVLTEVCYRSKGLDVIFRVHGDAIVGAFKHAEFLVKLKHGGISGQASNVWLFSTNLSKYAHEWVHNFIGQLVERMMHGSDAEGQMHETLSSFSSVICSCNSVSPTSFIDCYPYYLPMAVHPMNQSQTVSVPSRYSAHIQIAEVNSDRSDKSEGEYPRWIDLLPEIYDMILERLDAFETRRFPWVCRSWAHMYAQKRPLKSGTPTLLTSCGWDAYEDVREGFFFIHNILSMETYCVQAHGLRDKNWIGGKDEWLVTFDDFDNNNLELLNPITGACRTLPSFTTISDDKEAHVRWYSLEQVQLCRTPDEARDYFVIAIIYGDMLAYTRANSNRWFMLENPAGEKHITYGDAILHRGHIIAISLWSGDLWSWDLVEEGMNPSLLLRGTINVGHYRDEFILAPSMQHDDSVLIINLYGERNLENSRSWRSRKIPCPFPRTTLDVHGAIIRELDIKAKTVKDIHDIGDRSSFLGRNHPFYVSLRMPTGDLKANHVYVADLVEDDAVSIELKQDIPPENVSIELKQDIPPENVSLINYPGSLNVNQTRMWFRPSFTRQLAKGRSLDFLL